MKLLGGLITSCLALACQSAFAAGTVAVEIDGKAFTTSIECNFPNEMLFEARTPGMALAGSSRSAVVPAVGITLWAGQMGATIFTEDQMYQFGATNQALSGRTLDYEGRVASRGRDPYTVRLALDCDEPS